MTARMADIYGRENTEDTETMSAEPVVKVYSVHCSTNVQMPWANKPQEESTGSGFSIAHDGRLCILTNAHVVADATYIEVRKAGDAQKYVAEVARVSHECDLATLHVADAAFWAGVEPLDFGRMPSLQDEVSVVGYPEGGEGVSITQGVVSRIEIQRYAHSGAYLLAIQIDAAINPGNSGGPALDADGRVIGVAFQNQHDSQNIGYVIPVPTIHHYLKDARLDDPKKTRGFPSLGIYWQALDNPQLRAYLDIGEGAGGVLLRGVSSTSPAAAVLRRGDVLLELDGHAIANDGSFAIGGQERLSFAHLVHLKFANQSTRAAVLRDGAWLELEVPVEPLPKLIPATTYDEPVPYFIYAGLVFVPFTEPYLHEWGDEWQADAPHELVELLLSGTQHEQDEHPVLLSRVLPSRQTAGYLTLNDRRVLSVNGHRVLNLQQMHTLVSRLHTEADFLVFEVHCVGGPATIAISTATAEEDRDAILQTYRIPAAASPDLLRAS